MMSGAFRLGRVPLAGLLLVLSFGGALADPATNSTSATPLASNAVARVAVEAADKDKVYDDIAVFTEALLLVKRSDLWRDRRYAGFAGSAQRVFETAAV